MSHRPRIRARRGPHPGPPPAQTLLERAREECRRKKTSFREVDAFVPKKIAFVFFFFFCSPAASANWPPVDSIWVLLIWAVFRPSRCVTKSSKTPGFTRRGALR